MDLDGIQLALEELDPLLRAVAATGASMLIKGDEAGPIRFDGADPIGMIL